MRNIELNHGQAIAALRSMLIDQCCVNVKVPACSVHRAIHRQYFKIPRVGYHSFTNC
jgi:hypothetical protein